MSEPTPAERAVFCLAKGLEALAYDRKMEAANWFDKARTHERETVRATSERQSLPGYSHPVDALAKAYEIVGVTLDPDRLAEMRAYLDEEVEYEPPDEESEGVQ